MIHGIGTDIVDFQRINQLYVRYGQILVRRILSQTEIDHATGSLNMARLLAKRFAAKEAFAKAVGSGLRAPVLLRNISVLHDEWGRPEFAYAPELAQWLRARGIGRVHLSISDEARYVMAFAVAQWFEAA